MDLDKLRKEAEEWLNKWELCNKCGNKVDCISNFSYCKKIVLQAYQKSAEPREKRIEELEKACNETQELLDKQIEATLKLDKENVELKDNFKIAKDNEYEYSSLFIKAKEIINELFHYIPSWTGEMNDKPRVYAMPDKLRAKAERFLSEVKK